MGLVLISVALVVFRWLATTRFKLHPFLALARCRLAGRLCSRYRHLKIRPSTSPPVLVESSFISVLLSPSAPSLGSSWSAAGAVAITMAENSHRVLGEPLPDVDHVRLSAIWYPFRCFAIGLVHPPHSLKNALAGRGMKVSVICHEPWHWRRVFMHRILCFAHSRAAAAAGTSGPTPWGLESSWAWSFWSALFRISAVDRVGAALCGQAALSARHTAGG